MDIIDAITSRHACRAFLDTPVDHKLVQKILDTARWSPSGTNMQPWQVAVVSGGSRRSLTDKLIAARETGQQENPDYPYYPLDWYEPYKSRRRATGLALYSALNIQRGDTERQKQAWYDNYRFFGAPIGLMFFIEERLSQGSWVDMGMFIQSVMLAATGLGLATCPQFALAEYPDIVRAELAIPPELKLVTGMSLGYADPAHPLNSYRLERVPVEDFTRWYE